MPASRAHATGTSARPPSLWQGVRWALGTRGRRGKRSWALAARALVATLRHPKALRRWMGVVSELHARGAITDLPGEYLRAIRPYVHRHTDIDARVVHLIDHIDWMEAAVRPEAFAQLARGEALVLAELPPPRGYDSMRLQLRRNAPNSPEGELLLTLTLRRSPQVQPSARSMDVAALAFSRFRLDDTACLVIGGVRGQRDPNARLSSIELTHALQGWKSPVLMVRVAQELARFWGLRVVGLNPASHHLQGWRYQWSRRHRENAARIYDSYDALWSHFEARPGPQGWVVVPPHSDDKLAATALSPEKRARQTRRADYWIRTRVLLRDQFRGHLVRQGYEAGLKRVTENLGPKTVASDSSDWDPRSYEDDDDLVPSRVLQTGPGVLE